jgi:hypothetical protein
MNNIFTLKEIIERENSILNDYENHVLNLTTNNINRNKVEIDFYNLIQKYINETDKINKNKLDYNKNMLKKIDNLIIKKCQHVWINDLIDIDPDRSKSIKYCSKCYLTHCN